MFDEVAEQFKLSRRQIDSLAVAKHFGTAKVDTNRTELVGAFIGRRGPARGTPQQRLDASGIMLTSSGKVTIQASTVEVTSGSVTVNAGMSRFSGVVQPDTVLTNSIVSATYTPGAGNIL